MNHIVWHIIIIYCSLTSGSSMLAISMVYNFRIAQITRPPRSANRNNHTAMLLFFDQYREKYDHIHQNYGGGLASFIYDFDANYLRIDGAVSHIHEKEQCETTFEGTETDDILATLGHNFVITDNASLSLSGLFGIPTHRLYRLQHTDFGYSQVGAGIQLDGLYQLNEESILYYGGRYIYFVPRNAYDPDCCRHRFTIGNVGDLLIAYRKLWCTKHRLEGGYTFRARFGCHCFPAFDQIVEKTNYVRSNFYIVYSYNFLIREIQNRLYLYASYGFDHKSKIYGNKHIITLWTSWQVSF